MMTDAITKSTFQNLDILECYVIPDHIKQMCHSGTCINCENHAYFTGNILADKTFSLVLFCEKCDLFMLEKYPRNKE